MAFLDPSNIPSAEEVNQGHTNSDVDKSRLSQHHTLGTSATQASPGNHNHDGITSVKVKVTDLDGTLVATNGLPAGGSADQILSKIDATNYNAQWVTNTAIQKGDGIYVLIRNNTGSTLTKGQIVYTNGATGAKVTVALALATGDSTSARTLGFVADDILHNDQGYVQIEGYLSGVDTASLTDGAQLYLSGTTAGAYQTTKPVAPIHLVYVGVVAKAASAAGGGAIMVKCQNGYELDELHDVLVASKANLDVLSYESSTNLWKNKTLANAGIAALAGGNALTGAQTITGLSAGTTTLKIIPATTPSVDIFQIRNSADSANLFSVGSGGAITTASALTVNGLASFNNNISAFGTSTFWANQQLSLAVRNGTNAVTNLVQYSKNDATITGGVTTTGLIWAGTTAMENNNGYGLTTSAYVSTTQATFTTNSAVTQQPFAVGQKLIVTGVTGGTYNGSFIISAVGGSAGAWTATVTSPSGTTPFTNVAGTGGVGAIEPALFVRQPSAGTPALTIKAYGAASGSTEPFRYIDNTGVVKTYIAASGDFVAPAISAIWSMTSSAQDVTVNAMRARTSVASGYRANLQTWESSTTVLAGINSPGKFFTGSTTGVLSAVGGTIQSIAVGANPLVTMASAHGLAVGEVVTLAGTTGSTYNGTFYVATVPLTTTFTITSTLTVGQAAAGGTASIPPQQSITTRSAGTIGTVIRGASSQSASLTEWQDSAGTVLSKINASGSFYVNSNNNTIGIEFLGNAGTQFITANGNDLSIRPRFDGLFAPADSTGRFRPTTDNTSDLGTSGQRWKTLFASGATLNGLTLTSTTSPITLNGSVGTSGQVLTSAGAGATPTWTTVSGGSFTGGTLTSDLVLAAGSGTVEPLTFQTNVATPTVTSGAMDYDGVVFYQVANTTPGRALATQNYEYLLTTGYSPDYSVSGTAQSILNNPGVGITLVAGTTYEWELYVPFRYQSFGDATTFLSVGWNTSTVSGTPTVAFTEYLDYSSNTTSLATASTFSSLFKTTGTTQLVTSPGASGSRYGIWKSKGIIRVTGTGSIKFYPTLTASAATVNVITINNGTFFKLTPLGNGTVSTIGTWA